MLRDMARVEFILPQPLVHEDSDEKVQANTTISIVHVSNLSNTIQDLYGKSLFDAVSEMVYHVLEQNIQYHHYIKYLRLRQLSVPSRAVKEQSPTNSQSPSLQQ